MQLNKSIKIFINYFLGPVLFAWLLVSIYLQIVHQPHLAASWRHIWQSLQSYKLFFVLLVIVLTGVNWGLEAAKWQLSVQSLYPVSFIKAFKGVLSGVSFSVTMPNRVGEYAGRMMHLPEGHRLEAISATLIGSISQLIVTLASGFAGLIFLKERLLQSGLVTEILYRFIFYGTLAALLALTLIYFGVGSIGRLAERWLKKSRYWYLLQSLKTFNVQLLLTMLLLSFFRYIVFIAQYFLLFSLFSVQVSAGVVWCVVSVVFLAMAAIPTIALVEVGLRGKISMQLMGLFSANSLGIALTSVSIWFINLIVPALVGSVLILSIKVFKRKNGTC